MTSPDQAPTSTPAPTPYSAVWIRWRAFSPAVKLSWAILFLLPFPAAWLTVVPWGSDAPLAILRILYILLTAGCLCLILIDPFRKARGRSPVLLFTILAMCLGVNGAHVMRRLALGGIRERAQPIIAAIHEHIEDHGAPPAWLPALIPDYMSSIPGTGVPGDPDFGYDPGHGEPSGWRLKVLLPGALIPDFYIYMPNGNGKSGSGGEWVYVQT